MIVKARCTSTGEIVVGEYWFNVFTIDHHTYKHAIEFDKDCFLLIDDDLEILEVLDE